MRRLAYRTLAVLIILGVLELACVLFGGLAAFSGRGAGQYGSTFLDGYLGTHAIVLGMAAFVAVVLGVLKLLDICNKLWRMR